MHINREAPEGTHILVGTIDKLIDVWNRISVISGVFDDFTRGKPEGFLQLFFSRDTYWLERDDGNGILYFTMIQPRLSALAHVIYWDKRLRGREAFTMNCLLFGVNLFDLQKVNIYLPEFVHAGINFVERLGFQQEGKLRRWSLTNGKLYDILWYGMTREEVINGAGLLSEQDKLQPATTVLGDAGHPETTDGGGDPSSEGAVDPIQSAGVELNVRVGVTEHASDPGLPVKDPQNGGN